MKGIDTLLANHDVASSGVVDGDDEEAIRLQNRTKEAARRRKLYGLPPSKDAGANTPIGLRKTSSMSSIPTTRTNTLRSNSSFMRSRPNPNDRLSKTSDGLINTSSASETMLTDDKGKGAFSGTPGPGSYQSTSSFGPSQVYSSASRFSFGVKGMRYPFISKEHAQNERGTQSPGPVYATRSPDMIRSVSFGVAGRDSGSVQFISHYHCRENRGRLTPGPGTYHTIEQTSLDRQDLPGFTFCSSAQRTQFLQRAQTPSPSHYQHQSSLGSSPSYSFAPGGDPGRGKACNKNKESAIFISEEHARASSPRATTPGPGTYTWSSTIEVSHARPHYVDTASSARMKRASAYSFGKSKKFTEVRVNIT